MNEHRNVAGRVLAALAILAGVWSIPVHAQVVVSEDFTHPTLQSGSAFNWTAINGACLTAGTTGNSGSIPSCVGLPYYGNQTLVGGQNGYLGSATSPAKPDGDGYGALRLTNGYPNFAQSGAIVSTTPFDATAGVQITFKTVTYIGDSGGSGGDGADGISFFLLDASKYTAGSGVLGAWGGSLAYTCSNANPPYNGQVGAYLGLGIDEYGNFLNQGDNTASGYGYQPGRIGLRGSGSVSWNYLTKTWPALYPSTLTTTQQQAAVQNTCKTGTLWNYASANNPVNTKVQTQSPSTATLQDYAPIPNAYAVLPSDNIAYEPATTAGHATKRTDATPIYYLLNITSAGMLSLSYSIGGGSLTQVLSNQSITTANGSLPSTLLFGFAGSTGGSDNIHEIMCFQAAPSDQADSSATVDLPQDKLITLAQVYFPSYHTMNWWGQLTAQNLTVSGYSVVVSSTVNWDASCALTGGSCASMGGTSVSTQTPSSRSMLTWNGTQGAAFEWASLSSAERTALDPGVSASGPSYELNYLRGDRSDEVPVGGPTGNQIYRDRSSVLGDIIHSSPYWVGPPTHSNYGAFADKLYSSAVAAEGASGAQTYATFASNYAGRENIVYVGANDGFLHGFRSGSINSNQLSTATYANDGREVLAYMPSVVLNGFDSATPAYDYSSTNYSHTYGVDASPRGDDLFYSGAWHTWLVGGLGQGGSAVYALDITNPNIFSEANASSLVVKEWNGATLSCVGNSTCGSNLQNTFGTPVIWRFHAQNGAGSNKWGVVFGNGFPSQATGTIQNSATASIGSSITGSIGDSFTARVTCSGGSCSLVVSASGGVPSVSFAVGQVIAGSGIAAGTTVTGAATCTTRSCSYPLSSSQTAAISSESMSSPGTTLTVTAGSGIGLGQITGPGVAAGTLITGQVSGTSGGPGVYTVSIAQAVGSTSLQVSSTTMIIAVGTNISIGSTVSGTGVLAGTTIVSQVSGTTGGAGTYTVNQAQLVASESMGIGSTTLTITAGQGLTAGQTLSGPGVVSGTRIVSQVSGYTGGPGVYTVSKSQSIGTVGFSVLNSGNSGTAGIYVSLVDPADGSLSTYFLDTGYGPAQDPLGQNRPNGIAYAAPADLDGDNTADYVYAGDLFGNLWRFDLTSSNPANWSASSYGYGSPTPLYSTDVSRFPSGQPITSRPLVVMTPQSSGSTAVMVVFGTGQEFAVTPVSPTSYAAGQQSLYGVWDWDMSSWNTLAHASLSSLSASAVHGYLGGPVTAGNLVSQSTSVVAVPGGTNQEVVSSNSVCWFGVSPLPQGCASGTKFGWTLPFAGGTGEQLIYNPTYWQGVLQVDTLVPSTSTIFSCNVVGSTGWTMFLNAGNGGAFSSSSFLDATGSPMVTSGGAVVSGLQLNVAGSLTNFNNGTSNFYVGGVQSQGTNSSSTSQGVGGAEKGQNAGSGHRVTWTQLR